MGSGGPRPGRAPARGYSRPSRIPLCTLTSGIRAVGWKNLEYLQGRGTKESKRISGAKIEVCNGWLSECMQGFGFINLFDRAWLSVGAVACMPIEFLFAQSNQSRIQFRAVRLSVIWKVHTVSMES